MTKVHLTRETQCLRLTVNSNDRLWVTNNLYARVLHSRYWGRNIEEVWRPNKVPFLESQFMLAASCSRKENCGHLDFRANRSRIARVPPQSWSENGDTFGCTQRVVSPFFFFFVVAALHCKALPTEMSSPDGIICAFMRRYLDTCGCPFWQEFHILNISFSVIPAEHNPNKSTNGTEVLLPEQMAGGTSIHPLLKVSSITRVSCHFCQHEHTWREQGPLGHCITMITRYSTLRACMGH